MSRTIAVGAALATIAGAALTLTDRALAAAPAAPPVCVAPDASTFSSTQSVAIPDAGQVSTDITVSGAPTVLRDLDLTTFIRHGHTGDVRITLSHDGTTVLIKDETSAGGDVPGSANGWADLWNGTLWDDGADATDGDRVATDRLYTADGTVTPLVPEAALGAFVGTDPNGVWTLTVEDTAALDTGTLDGWSLTIAGQDEVPPLTETEHASSAPVAIADESTVTSTINVSGAKGYLWDVDLQAFFEHTAASDLDVTLSHAGRSVTITTDNGGEDDDLFNGTWWDDSAPAAVTSDPDSDTVTPEEAMAAFIGTDPNGPWTITVKDDAAGDVGTLASWKLRIRSTDGCEAPPVTPPVTPPAPPVSPGTSPPAAPVVLPPPPAPPVQVARLSARGLGMSVGTRRDRRAPYRFVVSGRLTPPAGTTICAGRVQVSLTAGKRVVARRTAALRKRGAVCAYRTSFNLRRKPAGLPRSGRLVVRAKFLGTSRVKPRSSRPAVVRIG